MFGEGYAAIPSKGIQAIPNQLKAKLKKTNFHFNTKVKAVNDNAVVLNNGKEEFFYFMIIATEPSKFISNLPDDNEAWKSVENLYFEVDKNILNERIIGLIADKDALINNFHYLENTSPILSVSVVKKHHFTKDELVAKVTSELVDKLGIVAHKLVKHYLIPKALPIMQSVTYMLPASETQLKDSIFLAGDHLSNGSLNAAMLNGESAAKAVVAKIEDGLISVGNS
jgi:protoporphyrinogen oxidase